MEIVSSPFPSLFEEKGEEEHKLVLLCVYGRETTERKLHIYPPLN